MLSEFRGQSLHVRECRRKVLRKVAYVSGENHLALSVQRVRDLHPVRDDGLSCFDELSSGWLTEVAGLRQLGRYLRDLCTDRARLSPALSAENSVTRLTFVPAADDA